MDRPALNNEFPLHPVGYSGAKQEFRRGVNVGNFAEEILATDYAGAPGFPLRTSASFAGRSEFAASYAPAPGKTGAALAAGAARQDLVTKYVKYANSEALPTEQGVACWATTSQLAYSAGDGAGGSSGQPPRKVQDCLWAGTKFNDRKVPLSVDARRASDQHRQQRQQELSASPYCTVEKDALQRAAADPGRAAARPQLAQPKDPKGEDAQVGRKAAGEFKSFFDKDWLRTGLRKK